MVIASIVRMFFPITRCGKPSTKILAALPASKYSFVREVLYSISSLSLGQFPNGFLVRQSIQYLVYGFYTNYRFMFCLYRL